MTRGIALAAAACDVVVARFAPLPWLGHAAIVLALATAVVAIAPRVGLVGVVATANLFAFCALAFYALCTRIGADGLVLDGDFVIAAVASFSAALLDVALVLRAESIRRAPFPVRAIALVAAFAAAGAAASTWPGYNAKLELTLAIVLATASWAPTPRRWYATAVVVAPLQCVLALGAWMVLAMVEPDVQLWLRVGFATVAAVAACLMTMRTDRLASPIPTACART